MAEQLSTGVTLTFDSGFFAKIIDVEEDDESREAIKTSHMGTTGQHTYIPSALSEPGGLQVEMLHDGTKSPPMVDAAETLTVALPDGTGYSVTAFMIGHKVVARFEDMVRATARLQYSGVKTYDTTPT